MLYSMCRQKNRVRFKVYTKVVQLKKLKEFLDQVDATNAPAVFQELKAVIGSVLIEKEKSS